jgi:hypothetical protein
MPRPNDLHPEGTAIPEERLLAIVLKHIMKDSEELPKDVDYYLSIVAEAAELSHDEVMQRHSDGDVGIVTARSRVKVLMFARVLGSGVSPKAPSGGFKA